LHKPIYVFGGLGIASILSGLACGIGAVVFKLLEEPYRKDLVETPLPLLAVLLIVLGANSLMLGLLAEISVRTYFESQEKKTYLVKEMIKAGETVGKDTGEPCRPERP
jgi:dolichol-phosphate mannosyltransferase